MDGDLLHFTDQLPLVPGRKLPSVPENQVIPIMKQILEGLTYLHAHNILHRDLKPDNILYKKSGSTSVKIAIADFGFSIHTKSPVCESLGSVNYAAPELFDSFYGTSVDVWAVGVICFCVLTGYFPFYCDVHSILVEQICESPVNWGNANFVSPDAKDFVESLLEKDPSRRVSAKGALDHPWLKV